MRRASLVLAFAAITLFAAASPAEDPNPKDPPVTFRSDVSLVRVTAEVVDRENRPIKDLRAGDFIPREGGKQLEIRNFLNEKAPVDVILLLSVSRSMEPPVERIASAAHQALGVLEAQDRIAIMVFDATRACGCRSATVVRMQSGNLDWCSTRRASGVAPISRGGLWTQPTTWPATHHTRLHLACSRLSGRLAG